VNVVAQLRNRIDGFDDSAMKSFGCEVVNRTRRIPFTAATARSKWTKLNRAGRIAVRVDRLAEKLNFRVAPIGEAAHIGEDRFARPASFRAARVRNYAIGAGIVAAFDNREIGAKRIIAPRDFGFEGFVRVEVKAHHPTAPRLELRNQFRKAPIAG